MCLSLAKPDQRLPLCIGFRHPRKLRPAECFQAQGPVNVGKTPFVFNVSIIQYCENCVFANCIQLSIELNV